jgi:hypothetical protein
MAVTVAGLAGGDLGGWTGLPPGLTRAAVEAELGPASTAGDAALFGTAAVLCCYGGLSVWYVAGAAELVEVSAPVADLAVLGAPDAVVGSGLGAGLEQRVWAGRGLAAHVWTAGGGVHRLYGFEPAPLDRFLAGPLARAGMRAWVDPA